MAFSGALITKSANQTGADFSASATVPFNSAIYNTGGWYSAGDPNLITVPAGVSRVRLFGQVYLQNITADQLVGLQIMKNGSSITPFVRQLQDQGNTSYMLQVISPTLFVNPGDDFNLNLDTNPDASVDLIAARTFFAAEAVPARTSFAGCRVTLSTNGASTNYTTATALPDWDQEDYDVGGPWHDLVTNPKRLTVPSGVSKVRVSAQIRLLTFTASNWYELTLRKNGSTTEYGGTFKANSTGPAANIFTPAIPVSNGDFFETLLQVQSDTSVVADSTATSMAIEQVE